MTKEVYDSKEHAKNDKAVGSKKATKAKAKPEKKAKEEHINKYGFYHVDKDLAKYLGVSFGKDKEDVPVNVERIEGGFTVKIVKA